MKELDRNLRISDGKKLYKYFSVFDWLNAFVF